MVWYIVNTVRGGGYVWSVVVRVCDTTTTGKTSSETVRTPQDTVSTEYWRTYVRRVTVVVCDLTTVLGEDVQNTVVEVCVPTTTGRTRGYIEGIYKLSYKDKDTGGCWATCDVRKLIREKSHYIPETSNVSGINGKNSVMGFFLWSKMKKDKRHFLFVDKDFYDRVLSLRQTITHNLFFLTKDGIFVELSVTLFSHRQTNSPNTWKWCSLFHFLKTYYHQVYLFVWPSYSRVKT